MGVSFTSFAESMMPTMKFLKYDESYFDSCIRLFDENCPNYFTENEKEDYIEFLKGNTSGYFVVAIGPSIVSAFGLITKPDSIRGRLSWILVSSESKGNGLGVKMMSFVKNAAIEKELFAIDIAANHLSAPFFKKFGAKRLKETTDGWGQGMHRIDMELKL